MPQTRGRPFHSAAFDNLFRGDIVADSPVGQVFDAAKRLEWAEAALVAVGKAAEAKDGQIPEDLAPSTGWRWRVLDELNGLSADLIIGYERASRRQSRQFWESRWGGPLATGGGAAIGSVLSAVGAGIIKTNTAAGWVLVGVGIVFAFAGSVFSANTYVRNRNTKLRYLRLLWDIWDYAYSVLPTAAPGDAYNAVDNIRSLWETAGT
jgi:hypothetical protein